MCIIAAKTLGTDWPALDIINNCCVNNPDGFAIAWNEDGEIKTFRTMDRAEFIARYNTIIHEVNPDTSAAIIHARWATHGSKKLENCHCWTGGGLAFAHNGVMSNVPNREDMTDSETFFRDYFLPVYETLGWDKAKLISRAIAGTNRLAWIDATGHIYLMGEWLKYQEQGRKGKLYFSNRGFQSSTSRNLFYTDSAFGRIQEVRPRSAKPAGAAGGKKPSVGKYDSMDNLWPRLSKSMGEMNAKNTTEEKFNRYGALVIQRPSEA